MWTTVLMASLLAIVLKAMGRSENDTIHNIGSILTVAVFVIGILLLIVELASNQQFTISNIWDIIQIDDNVCCYVDLEAKE